MEIKPIRVQTTVDREIKTTWEFWTDPEHITKWYFASEEWHCPRAVQDFRERGDFSYRMETKEGSTGFDYSGRFERIAPHRTIVSILDDGRRVSVSFTEEAGATRIVEESDPDPDVSADLQEKGWQSILDNFKQYAER